jgi:hypothetical protein
MTATVLVPIVQLACRPESKGSTAALTKDPKPVQNVQAVQPLRFVQGVAEQRGSKFNVQKFKSSSNYEVSAFV